jgi:tetratricopeptide (TPR) repeat protein
MMKMNVKAFNLLISLLLVISFSNTVLAAHFSTSPLTQVASPSAVVTLLTEAKSHFDAGENEQSAALLERALRIEPRNPVLWHNLAGVRLRQEDWARAASLAAKSNAFAVENKWLRVRNWIIIALACDGMGNHECARESRKRAWALAN